MFRLKSVSFCVTAAADRCSGACALCDVRVSVFILQYYRQ